jgi:hypothetical protein
MKQPVAGVTFYRGWRIVFDGEFFDMIDEAGKVKAMGFRTLKAAKEFIDVCCGAHA